MAEVKNSNFTMVPQNFFSGYHLEVTKFVTEARKGRNRTCFISGDGVKSPLFIENAGKYGIGYQVSAPFDLLKVAISESVTEQYKDELGFDPKIHSLRSCAAVQAFVKALEKSGTLDSSVEIDILKSVEKLDSVIGKLRFNESVIFGGLLMRFTRYVALRLASGLLRLNDNNEKILQKNRKLLERSRFELEFNINLSIASA